MSGHSKWATIKRKKGAADAKRGKLFTKLIKEITVSARMGGGDPDGNPRLRTAIAAARGAAMPKDNIERAIKKGTGELEGESYEEVTYEGYGPNGVAMMIETTTDNTNRTVANLRHYFDKYNGSLGQSGSVAWMFDRKGRIECDASKIDEDTIMGAAIDAGADDIQNEDGIWVVYTEPNEFHDVRDKLEAAEVPIDSAELSMIPQSTVKLSGKDAETMLKLMDILDDDEDVQRVHANFEIDAEEMERLAG